MRYIIDNIWKLSVILRNWPPHFNPHEGGGTLLVDPLQLAEWSVVPWELDGVFDAPILWRRSVSLPSNTVPGIEIVQLGSNTSIRDVDTLPMFTAFGCAVNSVIHAELVEVMLEEISVN